MHRNSTRVFLEDLTFRPKVSPPAVTTNRVASPRGLTLVELLVALVIVGTMLAVIIPGILAYRTNARRQVCFNNLKKVGLATLDLTTGNNGEFFPLTFRTQASPSSNSALIQPNWTFSLLSSLEPGGGPSPAENLNGRPIAVFVCPADTNNVGQPNGLSYVVNAGAGDWLNGGKARTWQETWGKTAPYARNHWHDVDWNGDGEWDETDAAIGYSTGVFHRKSYTMDVPKELWEQPLSEFSMTLSWIQDHDGLSQTLMMAENANAQNWGYSANTPTSNALLDTAFCLSSTVQGANPQADVSFGGKAGPLAIGLTKSPLELSWPHCNPTSTRGGSPAPSSFHNGVIAVVYCDGRAEWLSETVDHRIYVELMSSNGQQHGQSSPRDSERD